MGDSVASMADKAGMAPGSLFHVGERPEDGRAVIEYMNYLPEGVEETSLEPNEVKGIANRPGVTWIAVRGLHDVDAVRAVGQEFGLHPLVLEDILNTEQRSKFEDYGDYLFIVIKSARLEQNPISLEQKQVCIVLGPSYVISFFEGPEHPFEHLKARLRGAGTRLRKRGPDYLAHAIIDSVVDGYFHLVEDLGDLVQKAEELVFGDPDAEALQMLYRGKRLDLHVRRLVWPLREVVGALTREDSDLIVGSTHPFLRDVQDHVSQVIEVADVHRETLNVLLDLYLNSVSNRLNQVMKVLTIVATIFIPLTFITGLYGMNFKYMPELDWRWSYYVILGVMFTIAVAMLYMFRRRDWL